MPCLNSSVATLARTYVVLGVLVAAPRPALAQISFSAPRECGSQDEFLAEVRALQSADAPSIAVTSVLIAQPRQGVYELTLEGPSVRRVLSDGECRTLFRTAVVIAAAAATEAPALVGESPAPVPAVPLDGNPAPEAPAVAAPPAQPAGVAAAPPPAAPAALPPPASEDHPPAAAESTASAASPPSAVHFRVAAGGGVASGLSPDAALLFELGGALGSNRWGGSLVFKYLPNDAATTEGNVGLELETLGARAGGFLAPFEFLRVEAGVAVYRLTALGTGVRYPDTDSVWLVAPELEVVFVARLSPHWALEAGPQGRVGLTRPTFQVEPETEVFQVPRFGAAVVFRLQWASR